MYSDWTSLSGIITKNIDFAQEKTTLKCFSLLASKEITGNVVKNLASNLGISQAPEPSNLTSEKDVYWCMDVICFGLLLPLSEHEIIKDCVNIYCEWLTALHPNPKISVPQPIVDDPNVYIKKIIIHLHNLFVPRSEAGSGDTINRQAVLCHRVLRTLQHTVQVSTKLSKDSWDAILLFLLAINQMLLSPPSIPGSVGDQLCERVLSVLFEVWLLACVRCFPSPSLWKTFQECCAEWRHRTALIEQWNRVNFSLTARLLKFTYGSSFPELKMLEEDAQLVPAEASDDCIAQSWYRFLKIIGPPSSLCNPHVISHTPQFLQYMMMKDEAVEPHQHNCLVSLPESFLKAVKGIGNIIDAFLGLTKPSNVGKGPVSTASTSLPYITQDNRYGSHITQARPKCNSILHLFGDWLFEASLVGSDTWTENVKKQATEASRRPSSMIMDTKKGLSISQPPSLESINSSPGLSIERFESGRSEALGILCRIFCGKKTGEEILPIYYARFYVVLLKSLKSVEQSKECDETLANILINSSDLFRLDLDGIQVLLPFFIGAIELVLADKDLKIRSHSLTFDKVELRRSSINILMSIIALPLHFQTLQIRDISGGTNDRFITFIQLKPRLINILMNALQIEVDPQNTHMLLGALLLIVQDAVTYEEQENGSVLNDHSVPDLHILSSACSEKSAFSLASTSSNISSKNSSTTISNDPVSLLLSDENAEVFDATGQFDNAHALFVRATYLCCHRLISSWKTDLNVSLAALELLSGLSRMQIKDTEMECKRAVKWICDYICFQCSRPPPSHSKDLHSTIVAAFSCTTSWLMQHPYLLRDKDCLNTVLEVVELGISGSKSVGKLNEPIKTKDEKDLKPVSMRVRDAAEILLTVILEQIEYFPSEYGFQSHSSLLDEETLAKHCDSHNLTNITQEQAVQRFRYFVVENSTILAISDEPLGNNQLPMPSITVLLRGPFGRHAFTIQLRHLPRSKSGTKYHAANPLRPIAMNDVQIRHEMEQKFFPECVERIPSCCVDTSIPSLETIVQKTGVDSTRHLSRLLEDQVVYEKLAWAETESSEGLGHTQESIAPTVCHEFQATRLFLSHFGYLSVTDSSANSNELKSPSIIVLDSKKTNFLNDLNSLDKISPRTCDTVHIFYVRIGQNSEREIVENMKEENIDKLDPNFWNLMQSLGKPVDVEKNSAWMGMSSNNSRSSGSLSDQSINSEKISNDTENKVLYWSDIGAEIAFVLPTKFYKRDSGNSLQSVEKGYERSISEQQTSQKTSTQSTRTMSLDFEKNVTSEPIPPIRKRAGSSKPSGIGAGNAKIMLVWLESFEDHLSFPTEELLLYTRTPEEVQQSGSVRPHDCHIIFLHPLNSDLLRIKLQASPSRINFAIPLVDGMVVDKRVVGNLIRQTAYNMSRRKRLDNDSFQPPHVRRRLKVQDMIQNYKVDLTEPELLAHLFQFL